MLQNEKRMSIIKLRSDCRNEFSNQVIKTFCEANGIQHQLSVTGTPKQNGIVERRNRMLKQAKRTIIA